jgi:hypothetical protein
VRACQVGTNSLDKACPTGASTSADPFDEEIA